MAAERKEIETFDPEQWHKAITCLRMQATEDTPKDRLQRRQVWPSTWRIPLCPEALSLPWSLTRFLSDKTNSEKTLLFCLHNNGMAEQSGLHGSCYSWGLFKNLTPHRTSHTFQRGLLQGNFLGNSLFWVKMTVPMAPQDSGCVFVWVPESNPGLIANRGKIEDWDLMCPDTCACSGLCPDINLYTMQVWAQKNP